MSFLGKVATRRAAARSLFLDIVPGPVAIVKNKVVRRVIKAGLVAWSTRKLFTKEESLSEFTGRMTAGRLVRQPVMKKATWLTQRGHSLAVRRSNPLFSKNGLGGRNWIHHDTDSGMDGRTIKTMRIVYHHANKAGKHIDVHIGHLSIVVRVSGKPVEKKLKYHNGRLTEESKKALLNHLRSEIRNNSRFAQNMDHSITNGAMEWSYDESLSKAEGYGVGPTRQVIAEDKVEFYHLQNKDLKSLHMYAPLLNPHQGLYLYPIYHGEDTGTPILIWGTLIPRPERFKDRLHLKLIQPEELDKFISRSDITTCTRKYDGASTYFNSNGEGFKFFSPRTSKETGRNIEYTYKAAELAGTGNSHNPVGMGEMLFWHRTGFGKILQAFDIRGPEWLAWKYIPAAEIGGILNSNQVRPRDIFPEVRIYRIDRWDGKDTYGLPFWDNRLLQLLMTKQLGGFWRVVKLAAPRRRQGEEGLVAVPEGLSINDGLKLKWWGDAHDWQAVSNNLRLNAAGNIEGVVWFKSLESGRLFKLGPGQIGNFDDNMEIIAAGDKYLGTVVKVHGRNGHEGRAAKIVEPHLDKGTA